MLIHWFNILWLIVCYPFMFLIVSCASIVNYYLFFQGKGVMSLLENDSGLFITLFISFLYVP